MFIFPLLEAVAKYEALKLIFRDFCEKSKEVVMEKSIYLYLSHKDPSVSTTNYRVQIRDLFTVRVVAYKYLPVQNSGWYKVNLNRWPDNADRGLGMISTNHGLEIHVQQGRKKFDFEKFYKNNGNFSQKFLPTLLIYYQKTTPRSLKEFLNITEEKWNNVHASLASNPRRIKRQTANNPCSQTKLDMNGYFNLTSVNTLSYYPNTTTLCTGTCTPAPGNSNSPATPASGNSNSCDQRVQDCCVPSQTRAFTLLYLDVDGTLVLRTFPDMIVEACACASAINTTVSTASVGSYSSSLGRG